MRLKHFLIQFLIVLPLLSQNNYENKVDSILKESLQKFIEVQFLESSKLADQALQLSVSENYSKGKVMSNIYIAKVLVEIGLNMEALKYISEIYDEPFFNKNVIFQAESHRLKGKIYGNQQLYTLAKNEFNKQLSLSENIPDPKKKELSKLWAYQNIEHLYSLKGISDSIEVYQKLQEKQLEHFEEEEVFYTISTLYANKAQLFLKNGKFDEAEALLQKSIDIIDNYDFPYKYYTLQRFGDMEAARGNVEKALSYYYKALENSVALDAINTTRELHKRLAEYMLKNDTLLENAKKHGKEYVVLNDSLEKHNSMVADVVLESIIKDIDKSSAQKSRLFHYIVIGLIVISLTIVTLLFARNKNKKIKLQEKSRQLITTTEKIEMLEDELESNIFNEIIELAKSNSSEFLPLFEKGYPEFIEAMRELDPAIRSSELYFSALAYLNFSTKDIANFTFVTIRAVQVRRNRMRKKYDIPSDVDFNEWFRNLENEFVSVENEIKG